MNDYREKDEKVEYSIPVAEELQRRWEEIRPEIERKREQIREQIKISPGLLYRFFIR